MLQKGVDTGEHRGILGLHEIEEQYELIGHTWLSLSLSLFSDRLLEFFEVLTECRIESDEDLRI